MGETRRAFLGKAGAGAAALVLQACGTLPRQNPSRSRRGRKSKGPNILFVTTDYQSWRDGPSLGSPFLRMPALDRLCREGKVFSRHISTAPICMPARYTWITGQYPHTHGKQENGRGWLPPGSPILMELLEERGYHTVGVGKMHFWPWDRMAGYERRIIADCKNARGKPDDYEKFLRKHGRSRGDYLDISRRADIPHVYDWPWDEALHIDRYVGDQARALIQRGELEPPWFLWVSFNGPHNPWDPPAEYSKPYLDMDLPLGHSFQGELLTKPRDHTRLRYNYTREVVDRIDGDREHREEILRRIRAGHYGNLSLIDDALGGILSALEKRGELDKTLVVYASDHGSSLGDHDLIHKGTHYDSSARVPFVVRWPQAVKPGRVESFSSHVDLLPTLLSLAEAPVPPEVEGLDLSPLLFDRARALRDSALIEIRGNTSIVTNGWKMGLYPRDREGDLYDLRKDPFELTNIFDRSEYAPIRKALEKKLLQMDPTLRRRMEERPTPPLPEESVRRLRQGQTLPRPKAPRIGGRAFTIQAVLRNARPDGVLLAQGDKVCGFALYLDKGRLTFAARHWGKLSRVVSRRQLTLHATSLTARLAPDGTVTLEESGRIIGSGKVPGPIPSRPGRDTPFTREPLHAGRDPRGAFGPYTPPNPFQGSLEDLVLRLGV